MARRLRIGQRVSRVVGVALVLVGATGLTAARADAQTAKVPIILSVQAAAGDDQIVIRGTNLPVTMPRVTLEGAQLQLITWNASQITAVLPGLAPGSYLLTLQGSAWYQVAVFVATIGAPRLERIVELRYFGGLTIEEAAEVVGISEATLVREWTIAKAWLRADLSGSRPAKTST